MLLMQKLKLCFGKTNDLFSSAGTNKEKETFKVSEYVLPKVILQYSFCRSTKNLMINIKLILLLQFENINFVDLVFCGDQVPTSRPKE